MKTNKYLTLVFFAPAEQVNQHVHNLNNRVLSGPETAFLRSRKPNKIYIKNIDTIERVVSIINIAENKDFDFTQYIVYAT